MIPDNNGWRDAYMRLYVMIPECLNTPLPSTQEELWKFSEEELSGFIMSLGREIDDAENQDDTELAVAISCVKGDWRTCQEYPWTSCCAARLRLCAAVDNVQPKPLPPEAA